MYGGLRKSVFNRWFLNFWWKNYWRRIVPVYSILWTLQVLGHRDYDNNAYAYFYFSD